MTTSKITQTQRVHAVLQTVPPQPVEPEKVVVLTLPIREAVMLNHFITEVEGGGEAAETMREIGQALHDAGATPSKAKVFNSMWCNTPLPRISEKLRRA